MVLPKAGQTTTPTPSPTGLMGGAAFGESLAASTGRLGRGTFLKARDDMWRSGEVRASASPPGALGNLQRGSARPEARRGAEPQGGCGSAGLRASSARSSGQVRTGSMGR